MTRITHLTLAALAVALLLASSAAAGGQRTPVVAADDWPPDSGLSFGELSCPGGEIVIDPVTGFEMCSPGSRTRIRGALYYSCVHGFAADGTADPRFTGVMAGSMNANWDAGYSGSVWGTWLLVPTDSCDRSALEEPDTYWVGRWHGRRTAVCAGGPCFWVGDLAFVGRGRGDLRGLHFRGSELVLTHTPFPLPYELLPLFELCQPGSCPTGAEGHFTGAIR